MDNLLPPAYVVREKVIYTWECLSVHHWGGGGYPIQLGVPHHRSMWRVPHLANGGGGTPSQVWTGGYPIPGLARGVPHGTGYPPDLRWGTLQTWDRVPPPPNLGWGTPPRPGTGYPPRPGMEYPPWTWDGVPPPPRPGMGYPPQTWDGVSPPPAMQALATATRRAVCPLRSRRRTFLFVFCFCFFFQLRSTLTNI